MSEADTTCFRRHLAICRISHQHLILTLAVREPCSSTMWNIWSSFL